MKTEFVVRLLDADNELLSWARVVGVARPQPGRASCPFWTEGPTQFVVERDGVVAKVAIHWLDLDIARVKDMEEPVPVKMLQVVNFGWGEPIWLTAGMQNVPLPAVTERGPVAIGVPPGKNEAVGQHV